MLVDDASEHHAADRAEDDADDAAHAAEHTCLDQKLGNDARTLRADGAANTDLAGALGHGDEHDVHDADAADEQRDRRDAAEHHTDHVERLILVLLPVVRRPHLVIAAALRDKSLEEAADVGDGGVRRFAVARLDNVFREARAAEHAARRIRKDDHVVHLLHAIVALIAARGVNADDGEVIAVDLERLADRIDRAEENLRRLRADDADLIIVLNVQIRKVASLGNGQIVARAVLVGAVVERRRTADEIPLLVILRLHRGRVLRAVDHGGVRPSVRRNADDIFPQSLAVFVKVGEIVLADVVAVRVVHP